MTSDRATSQPHARRRLMLYCPEAFIRPHFVFLQFIGRILRDLGHEVFVAHCDHLLPHCVSKDSVMLPATAPAAQASEVCAVCVATFAELIQQADIPAFALRQAIHPETIDALRSTISQVPDSGLVNFTYDGVDFGKLCHADLLGVRKLMRETPLEPEHCVYMRNYLVTTLASYIGMVNFLVPAGFTDVLIYGEYATCLAAAYAAEKVGLRWKMLHTVGHLGFDRRRFYVAQALTNGWKSRMIDSWPEWRAIPLKDDEVVEVARDIRVRLGSSSIVTYSPAKTQDLDVLSTLGLAPGRRVIVACTSSLDEYNSYEIRGASREAPNSPSIPQAFSSQSEWLTFLTEEVGKRPDLQLVIRIHPREDANKRDPVRSRHLDFLRTHLARLPENVKVVWPADPVSSYDLLEICDVALVWLSTVGLEAARLGVPVIRGHASFPNYPLGDFAFCAADRASFLALINDALNWWPDFDCLVKAWRFYAYSRFFCSFDVRDVAPEIDMQRLPEYRRPAHAEGIVQAILGNTTALEFNRQNAAFWNERGSSDREAASIKTEIAQLFHSLMTGQEARVAVNLTIDEGPQLPDGSRDGRVAIDGGSCRYAWNGEIFSRYSPMCRRLAILAAC